MSTAFPGWVSAAIVAVALAAADRAAAQPAVDPDPPAAPASPVAACPADQVPELAPALGRIADWFLDTGRPEFGTGVPGFGIDFPAADQRKETLENGEVVFRVRGTITNSSGSSLDVPDLRVVFADARDRTVADWTVRPAKRRLAPGESVTVEEAIGDVPPGAASAALGWSPR
jgi:hypothetical protein